MSEITNGFPREVIVNKIVYKKQIYDQADILYKDRRLFIDSIETITWSLSFKPDNTNINSYKDNERIYEEVVVFHVLLKKDRGLKRISDIIMRAIPYPMLIIYEFQDQYAYYVSHQSISKTDYSKNTLDDIIYSNWHKENIFNFSKIMSFKTQNLYEFYNGFVEEIIRTNAIDKGFNQIESIDGVQEVLTEVVELENQIQTLRALLKKETQFNKQMDYNMNIKKLEIKIKKLKGDINE